MTRLAALYRREPARINGLIAAAVVALLAFVGLTADQDAVTKIVAVLAPIVLAELTRAKVTPTGQ